MPLLQTNSTNPFLNPSASFPKAAPFVPPKPNPNAGNPYGIQPSPMSVGQPARSPQTAAVTNSLPSGQVKPPTTTGPVPTGSSPSGASGANTGLIGNPGAVNSNPYPGYVSQLAGYGDINNDPGYMKLIGERNSILSKAPQAINNIENGSWGIPETVAQSREGQTTNLYSNLLASKEAEINNYLTGRGQGITATSGAVSASAPRQQGYALLNPMNNQPVGGGSGGLGGLSSLAYTGGTIDAAGTAAGKNVQDKTSLATGRSQLSTLQSQLSATPDFNTDPVNIGNSIKNFLQGNLSNPKYATIQSSLRNVVAQYSQILGDQQMNSLMEGAQVGTLNSFLANLDRLAQAQISNNEIIGRGGPLPPAPTAPPVTSPAASSPQAFQRKDGSVVHLQPDGTYQ